MTPLRHRRGEILRRSSFFSVLSLARKHGRKTMSIANAFVEVPAYDDLVARAHALVPDFADRAARCESDCRVSDEAVEQFRATGLHKTLLPAAYGGYEMGFSALLETSFSIGMVCASSAWVCGLYMVHNWLGGLFPKKAQDELWGQDPGTFISGSYAPIGKATSVEGGYLLSGRFPFASGSPGAAWNLCGAMLPIGPESRPVPAFTLVPKADYKLDWESWRPVGLSGTGSFDVIVENAFVPDYRVLRFSDAVGSTAPGAESNKNPLYRISLLTGVAFCPRDARGRGRLWLIRTVYRREQGAPDSRSRRARRQEDRRLPDYPEARR